MLNARLAAFAVMVLLVAGCASPTDAPAEIPLVCQVSADRGAFEGQSIVLQGVIRSDFHHGSGLAHADCPDAYVPLGNHLPGVVGAQEFYEAWRGASWCRDDPLYVTITGKMRSHEEQGRTYLALSAIEYRDIRHAPGSTCPITLEELYERVEQGELDR